MTQQILDIFESYRMTPLAIDEYEAKGKSILASKIEKFTATNSPIYFTMLGLPFKSTNTRDKVLGKLPDLGEELTIKNFEHFNAEVSSVYSPGIKMVVASDGYMFNDILGETCKTVAQYKEITESFRSNSAVDIIDINEFFPRGSTSSNREKIMKQFGYSWVEMEREILLNPDVQMLYKGMLYFMEQEIAYKDFPSRNQRAKEAKRLTREMMLRNEAYNRLVRHDLTDYIRLSMHPSVNNGYKYSFKLIPGAHTNHSPWHSAIVLKGNEAITMHKIDAEREGYSLVYRHNQPYNFITE